MKEMGLGSKRYHCYFLLPFALCFDIICRLRPSLAFRLSPLLKKNGSYCEEEEPGRKRKEKKAAQNEQKCAAEAIPTTLRACMLFALESRFNSIAFASSGRLKAGIDTHEILF